MKRYVDLDATLAFFSKWRGANYIGDPIPDMVDKVKKWIANGDEVTIFTARLGPADDFVPESQKGIAKLAIENWCKTHIGQILPVTGEKGFFDIGYDDRICHIIPNTGLTVEESLLKRIDYMRQSKKFTDSEILQIVVDFLDNQVHKQK